MLTRPKQEVRSLQVKDVFGRTAEIRLKKTKTRHERILPLLGEVGSAIAGYLLYGRPRIGTPQVFLRHLSPLGPITSTGGIGRIAQKHLLRAGIHASLGVVPNKILALSHLLERDTVAQQLLYGPIPRL